MMLKNSIGLACIVLAGMMSQAAAEPKYDPGASDTEIVIGNTAAYSGAVAAVGTPYGKSFAAYFKMINDQGGINGRKIRFISEDDAYSPPKTVEQTRRLVEQENVLFMMGQVGTGTSAAAQAYLNAKKIPQLFVASGGSRFNDPGKSPWSIGWQSSYVAEGRVYGKYVREEIKDARIAILYQNDDFGKDYVKGFKEGFGDGIDTAIAAELTYDSTDPTLDSQILRLKDSGANVFFNVSTGKFAVLSMSKVHQIGWNPLQIIALPASSVAGSLTPVGLDKVQGIISAVFVMDPTDERWKDSEDYKTWTAFMDKYYPDGNKSELFNVMAYGMAQTTAKVLRQAGDDLTRENIMKVASSMKDVQVQMTIPGIKLNTGPKDFGVIEQLQLVRFEGTSWQPFGKLFDASR